MNLTNEEIVRKYKNADNKKKQMKILCELNACDEKEIREILVAGGVPFQSLPRERKKKEASPKLKIEAAQEAPTIAVEPAEATEGCPSPPLLPTEVVLGALAVALEERKARITEAEETLKMLAEERDEIQAFIDYYLDYYVKREVEKRCASS